MRKRNRKRGVKMSRTIDEEKIQKEYIAKRHYENLKKYLERTFESSQSSFPYIVSFRHTGEYSVMMLNAGAAAKPHTILKKTIKEGAMTEMEAQYRPLTLLYGLTAYREKGDTDIMGMYAVTEEGESYEIIKRNAGEALSAFISRMTGISEEKVKALESKDKETILAMMKDESSDYYAGRYAMRYVAGDYDLHDLLGTVPQIHPVPSDSDEEFRAMNDLNAIFMAGKRYDISNGNLFVQRPYYPVQHGPQYNYIAHMFSKEPKEVLLQKVAAADFPVAVLNVRSGEIVWTEIDCMESLEKYYEENYAVMKNSWGSDFPAYITARAGKSFEEYMKAKGGAKADADQGR